jgi:hypothetical protein
MTEHSVGHDSAAEAQAPPAGPDDELLPSRLAGECAITLGAAGAGISLSDGRHRLPLGASDETAAIAERLQFTLGEGPCLETAGSGRVLFAEMADIERRWPAMADELVRATPYRAIVCLPLDLDPLGAGALDVYFDDSSAIRSLSLADAVEAAAESSRALRRALADAAASEGKPSWLGMHATGSRGNVWLAVGIMMAETPAHPRDVLATLRAYSYARAQTLDDTAAALVGRTLQPSQVNP